MAIPSMHGACHASYIVFVIRVYFINYTYFYFYTHHTPCLEALQASMKYYHPIHLGRAPVRRSCSSTP